MTESNEALVRIAENLSIGKIRGHIFLCADQTKPECSPLEVSVPAWDYLKRRLAELNLTSGEVPRAPDWKLRAKPNPWDVQSAFDNSPVTRWRSWQTLFPGMYVAVEFARPEISDSVLLECGHDQYKIRLKLEGMDESGKWKTLAEKPEESEGQMQLGLRGAAVQEVKARGVDYLLIYDFDYRADDFKTKYRVWGMTLLAVHNGARLYRLD